MLRNIVTSQRAKDKTPGTFFLFSALFWNVALRIRGRSPFPIKRFISANRLPSSGISDEILQSKSIGILFLAAEKDFEMLPFAIPAAINSIHQCASEVRVTVIVPSKDIAICQSLLGAFSNLTLVDEETVLSEDFRLTLKHRFGERYGWALQQVLKVVYVLESNLDGVFVVDADTILIDRRNWITQEGHQVLTPSDEFNPSYYEFLSSVGLGSLAPEFTFVSHHMMMQPWILREAFAAAGWKHPLDLLNAIVAHTYLNEQSPFSIDYELYAQYIMKAHPDLIELQKWSNLSVPRRKELELHIQSTTGKFSNRFSSISFHSYL